MTAFPKPIRREKVKKGLNKLGPVGRRRLEANKKRKPLADTINFCEIGPILRNRGISFVRCDNEPLTWAHSVKCSKRGRDPILEDETARSCWRHHAFVLDLLKPELTAEIVREAIRRRKAEPHLGTS